MVVLKNIFRVFLNLSGFLRYDRFEYCIATISLCSSCHHNKCCRHYALSKGNNPVLNASTVFPPKKAVPGQVFVAPVPSFTMRLLVFRSY